MRFAYHADDVIVMFTFVEEIPLKELVWVRESFNFSQSLYYP